MNVKDERKGTDKRFEELMPGDIFEFEGNFLMKTEDIEYDGDILNAVNVADGDFRILQLDWYVTPLVVQLRIIRND